MILWAETYNDPQYFQEDPIAFPTLFAQRFKAGKRSLADVEIAAVFAAHFAWGRRAMIIRGCGRLFEEMDWKPYEYVMRGKWRDDGTSIHRNWRRMTRSKNAILIGGKGQYAGNDKMMARRSRGRVLGVSETKDAIVISLDPTEAYRTETPALRSYRRDIHFVNDADAVVRQNGDLIFIGETALAEQRVPIVNFKAQVIPGNHQRRRNIQLIRRLVRLS